MPSMQKEFTEVEARFCESMVSTAAVKTIWRIENGDLWHIYMSWVDFELNSLSQIIAFIEYSILEPPVSSKENYFSFPFTDQPIN